MSTKEHKNGRKKTRHFTLKAEVTRIVISYPGAYMDIFGLSSPSSDLIEQTPEDLLRGAVADVGTHMRQAIKELQLEAK